DTSKTDIDKKIQGERVAAQGNPNTISENPDKAIVLNNQIGKSDISNDTIVNGNKKSIFEVLEAQDKEEEVVGESDSRWSAGPNVAPVYFNAMGEGSPIDPGFSPNAKSGTTNMSYGVSIAYAVTKKLSVRSGIHKAEYGYNTNNVGFSPTLAVSTSGRLQNIDYTDGPGILAENSPNLNLDSSNGLTPEFSSLNSARDGTIAQSFGYLEVPLELDYALIDRRFGVNLVGGISSLFLIDNSVTLNSGELTTEIGEARNLNDLNFSTNVGFGVNYKFTPKVQLNIEPVFKYQLNTFSNVSGDFRPFSIGVYSGLNFRF
ncbi:outer membrane beta-barrel protein, partial [Pricia sp.]|uniref:outer membrane beta-barrel protein n=1 Tax=Pricia sp. TaxID=2268138 RepID=UPI003593FA37